MTAPPATASPATAAAPRPQSPPTTPRPWDEADVRAALADARALADGGRHDLALLRAWAAAEAALRLAADGSDPDEEDPLPPTLSPKGMLEFAATRGMILRPTYFAAVEAVKARDALAHGFAPPAGADLAEAPRAVEAVAAEAFETLAEWSPGGAAGGRRAA